MTASLEQLSQQIESLEKIDPEVSLQALREYQVEMLQQLRVLRSELSSTCSAGSMTGHHDDELRKEIHQVKCHRLRSAQ